MNRSIKSTKNEASKNLLLKMLKSAGLSKVGCSLYLEKRHSLDHYLYNYLVGRVVETNYLSSRVLLLNDLNSRIPVTLNQGAQAILSGSGTKNPILEYLPEDYETIEDINVFASGKDGIFTSGTPIGITNTEGTVDL